MPARITTATKREARQEVAALYSGGWYLTEPKLPWFKKVSVLWSLPKMGCWRGCFTAEQLGKLNQGKRPAAKGTGDSCLFLLG